MSASTSVLQLVRAHYRCDQIAFKSAALSLARGSKSQSVARAIVAAIRDGDARPAQQGQPAFKPLHTPPTTGLLQPLRPVGFAELMLAPDLQAFLDEIVSELEYREELAERKLRPRNRILFYGPPGNGKSSCAAAIAKQLGVPAYGASLPRVIDKYVGGTGQNIGEIFASLTPSTLVVLDEIDALGATRGQVDQSAGKEFNSTVNTLLTLLDRNRAGIIIATTNRPDILDPALLRRFDEQIEVPAPSAEQMRALSQMLCEGYKIPLVDVSECRNFDAVQKTVERQARRIVMAEILAAEAAAEDDETAQDAAE